MGETCTNIENGKNLESKEDEKLCNDRRMMMLDVNIEGIKEKLLVDTGSTHTIIAYRWYCQIPEKRRPKIIRDGIKMIQADGSTMELKGYAVLSVTIGTRNV